LSKIENKQFGELENVSVQETLNNSLLLYENGIVSKGISINKNYIANPIVPINRGLCEILVNNLVQNAVRHNIQRGSIQIKVDATQMVIENSGPIIENSSAIFERFTRSEQSVNSIGLGLAIVKEIAVSSDMAITYHSEKDRNCFILRFKI
jgi:signal transduction histidine kinase